jgi:hypothetical protein
MASAGVEVNGDVPSSSRTTESLQTASTIKQVDVPVFVVQPNHIGRNQTNPEHGLAKVRTQIKRGPCRDK